MSSINKKTVIDLKDYAELLDKTYTRNEELYALKDENITLNSSQVLHSPHLTENNEMNHDEEQLFYFIEQLQSQQQQCTMLSDKLTSLENQACLQKMNSLIATGSSAIQQLQTGLASVNSAIQNHSLMLDINRSPTLPLDRSAQRAFVETVTLLSKLCNSLEETVELLKNASSIDWETVKKSMEEFLRRTKTLFSEMERAHDESSEFVSTLNEAINCTVKQDEG